MPVFKSLASPQLYSVLEATKISRHAAIKHSLFANSE